MFGELNFKIPGLFNTIRGMDKIYDTGGACINVKALPYNAIGDGVADDSVPINAAIAALPSAGGIIFIPQGTYLLKSSIALTKPIQFIGAGFSGDQNNSSDAAWNPSTQFTWGGATSGSMLTVSGPLSGILIANMAFDGKNIASIALDLNQFQFSTIQNIGCRNLLDVGIKLYTTSNVLNIGSSHNIIQQYLCSFVPQGIRLDGTLQANVCHNVFQRMTISYTGTAGFYLVNADNNVIQDLFAFQQSGTGVGVLIDTRAYANYFYHVEANGGLQANTPVSQSIGWSNTIFGYDRGNGEPAPTIQTGARLSWTEDGQNALGWQIGIQYASQLFSGSIAVNWANGNVQYVQLATGSQSITLANPISGGRYLLQLQQPASGAAGTVSWPASVLWSGGTAPTLTTTNSKVDIIALVYSGQTSKYYGSSILNF